MHGIVLFSIESEEHNLDLKLGKLRLIGGSCACAGVQVCRLSECGKNLG